MNQKKKRKLLGMSSANHEPVGWVQEQSIGTTNNRREPDMKSKLIRFLIVGAVIAFMGASVPVQAILTPITGNITFAGTVNLDTASAGTAAQVTGWHGLAPGDKPQVQSVDGTFGTSVTAGDGATFTVPWSFNSGALAALWAVDGFTFDLIGSAVTSRVVGPPGSVSVGGTGMVSAAGFAPTLGSWTFTTQDTAANSKFSFSASTAVVPDGGTTVLLLGVALSALGLVKRRLA
jgi:hypothetical protein